MQVAVNKLKGKLVELGLTQENAAEKLKMDRSTFYRKMKGDGLEFSIGEMHALCELLSLTNAEAVDIFLSK